VIGNSDDLAKCRFHHRLALPIRYCMRERRREQVVRYGSRRISFPPAVEVRWRRVRSASSFSSRKILPRRSTTRNWNINSRFDERRSTLRKIMILAVSRIFHCAVDYLERERAGRRCIGLASRRVISGCGMPAADQNHCTRCQIPMPRRNLSDTKRGSAITRNCERAVMNENYYTRPQCTRRCTVAEIAGKCRSVSCDLTSNAKFPIESCIDQALMPISI